MQHPSSAIDVLLAEHAALRDEILRRADHRITLLVGSLTASAALLGVGIERRSAALLLVLPLLLALFGLLIGYHHVAIRDLGAHVAGLESVLAELTGLTGRWAGWQSTRSDARARFRRLLVLWHVPVLLVIVLPGALALALPWIAFAPDVRGADAVVLLLSGVDVLALVSFVVVYVREVTVASPPRA